MKPTRRGRPALQEGETSAQVTVRVAAKDYDGACAKARRDRVTVPDVMRRALSKLLRDEPPDGD